MCLGLSTGTAQISMLRVKSLFSLTKRLSRAGALAALTLMACGTSTPMILAQQPTPAPARLVGTIQSISGNSLAVISDTGTPATVLVEAATRFLQIEPGKTDLKEARPLSFAELQSGDRVLVRGVLAEDGKTIHASSVIAVKKALVAEKQAKERAEWQQGVGGLVKSIDPSASVITVTTNNLGVNKEVSVHFTPDTIFRRYASDSTRFDAAKIALVTEIKPGDQLRARGNRSASTADFNATEIVSGTFRSIAGTVVNSDAVTNTLVVQDLASKTAVTLKVTPESQMRKLPAPFAEGLAARLKNQSTGTGQTPAAASPGTPRASGDAVAAANQNSHQGNASSATPNGRGDFQQTIARMPPSSISDLQKGDVVMVVTTQGNGKDPLTVITLLSGVEALLRAPPQGARDMILSPWSLGAQEPSGN